MEHEEACRRDDRNAANYLAVIASTGFSPSQLGRSLDHLLGRCRRPRFILETLRNKPNTGSVGRSFASTTAECEANGKTPTETWKPADVIEPPTIFAKPTLLQMADIANKDPTDHYRLESKSCPARDRRRSGASKRCPRQRASSAYERRPYRQ